MARYRTILRISLAGELFEECMEGFISVERVRQKTFSVQQKKEGESSKFRLSIVNYFLEDFSCQLNRTVPEMFSLFRLELQLNFGSGIWNLQIRTVLS